jgi:hypothetical protein
MQEQSRRAAKELIYLSPSSFMMWRSCPEKFFLKKGSGYKFESKQGIPAAMGCAFDAFVKRWIAHKIGLSHEPKLQMETLIDQIDIPDTDELYDEIVASGRNTAEFYVNNGLAQRLVEKENVIDLEMECFNELDGVRLLGKPDGAIKFDDGRIIPLDWKVRGYKSKYGYSPTQGYISYVTADGQVKSAHAKNDWPLEKLNENWAIQMTIYYWLLNDLQPPFTEPAHAAIEEVCFGAKHLVFTQMRPHITVEFQNKLWEEIKTCWLNWKFPPAVIAQNSRCRAYNQLCDCAARCEYYLKKDESVWDKLENANKD